MTSQPSQAADAVSPPIPPSIVYSQAASEVTRLSTLSKSEEIYQNAVKEVLAKGAGEGLSEEEIAFITSKGEAGSLSTLRQEIEADMEKRTFWNPNAQSPFRKTSKKVLKTIERFEKVIEPMVKLASMLSDWIESQLLTDLRPKDRRCRLGRRTLSLDCKI